MVAVAPNVPASVFRERIDHEAESIYEIATGSDGLPFGIAIADIGRSQSHRHDETLETYTVVQGTIELTLDGKRTMVEVGGIARINPGVVHSVRAIDAEGARLVVVSIPAWTEHDHHLVGHEPPASDRQA
jgi:mannose-6-phosphate isomerase-like protein (cupin superfamily)